MLSTTINVQVNADVGLMKTFVPSALATLTDFLHNVESRCYQFLDPSVILLFISCHTSIQISQMKPPSFTIYCPSPPSQPTPLRSSSRFNYAVNPQVQEFSLSFCFVSLWYLFTQPSAPFFPPLMFVNVSFCLLQQTRLCFCWTNGQWNQLKKHGLYYSIVFKYIYIYILVTQYIIQMDIYI